MDERSNELLELLDLQSDGALGAEERVRLEAEVEGSARLQSAQRQLLELHTLLRETRVQPRAGFRDQVMASLPAEPTWARARSMSPVSRWRVPLAAMVLLAVAAAFLASLDPQGLETAASAGGLLAAIGGMVTSTLMAGAGLLGASWQGVGMALGEALTLPQQVVFGVALVGLNLFLFRLVANSRRTRATEQASRESQSGVDSGE